MNFIPPFPVIVPLFFAALIMGIGPKVPRAVIDISMISISAVITTFCIFLFINSPIVYWFGSWYPRNNTALGVSFTIDKIGSLFAALGSFLTTISFIYSSKYFNTIDNLYSSLVLTFLSGLIGFCLSSDFFNMFVFFELMSISAYALTAQKNEGGGPLQGTLHFAVINTIGGSLILLGISLIYSKTGVLNFAQAGKIISSQNLDLLLIISFLLISIGFFIKAALFPFHFAGVDAHTVAPTPVLILFSGIMSQVPLYGIARIYWSVFNIEFNPISNTLSLLFVVTGAATIIIASLMCFKERSLKRMLAFSTVSTSGIFIIGISMFNAVGLTGTLFYIIVHAFLKSSLFMCTGILLHRFKSIDEEELYGRGKSIPYTGLLFFISALGLAGLPPSGVFNAKPLIETSASLNGFDWIKCLLLFESFVTGGAMIIASAKIFLGLGKEKLPQDGNFEAEDVETEKEHRLTPAPMFIPVLILDIAAFSIGFFPSIINHLYGLVLKFENQNYFYSLTFYKRLPVINNNFNYTLNFLPGILSAAGAIIIACIVLLRNKIFKKINDSFEFLLKPLMRLLVSIHSSLLGDYITWLMFGLTAFGLLAFVISL